MSETNERYETKFEKNPYSGKVTAKTTKVGGNSGGNPFSAIMGIVILIVLVLLFAPLISRCTEEELRPEQDIESGTGLEYSLHTHRMSDEEYYNVKKWYAPYASGVDTGDRSTDVIIPNEYKGKPVIRIGGLTADSPVFDKSLTSLKIGYSVEYITRGAFNDCTSLSRIEVENNNSKYKSIDGNLYTKDGKSLIRYAAGKKATSFVIPDYVTIIEWYAFQGCTSLTSVTISNSVQSISHQAFQDCGLLTSINFQGTKEQWDAISKGTDWDDNTGSYTIYCIDGTISKQIN